MINQPTHFDQLDLAHILYQVYREMFQHEDMGKLFSKIDIMTLQNSSNPHYHRGSFAAFLRLVKSRVSADWDKVMDALLDLVQNDPTKLFPGIIRPAPPSRSALCAHTSAISQPH